MDADESQKLFDVPVGGSFANLRTELENVYRKTKVGKLVFEKPFTEMMKRQVSALIEAQVKKLAGKRIDATAIQANRQEMVGIFEMNHLQAYEAFPKPKPLQINYRNVSYPTMSLH